MSRPGTGVTAGTADDRPSVASVIIGLRMPQVRGGVRLRELGAGYAGAHRARPPRARCGVARHDPAGEVG
jgi:hypothetical protein